MMLVLLALCLLATPAVAFVSRTSRSALCPPDSPLCAKKDAIGEGLGGSVATRGLFSLAEGFGWLSAKASALTPAPTTGRTSALSKRDVARIASDIRKEYEAIFWATGNMDTSLWAPDCTFADPFSSFGGAGSTQRFKRNADNLGRLVLQPRLKVTSFDVGVLEGGKGEGGAGKGKGGAGEGGKEGGQKAAAYTVSVGWTFSSKLNLPWRPVLAAAGITTHYLDNNGLIVRYEEQWRSDPWEVVFRLFKPTKSE
ncbi:hypothetical protein B484DRAFT_228549 [Ochromonadaceae sp. CCMP2298]|nr:hypothetical protein B484DRAFT_228549 [Ochromonadaceae sp. CCMP2298]